MSLWVGFLAGVDIRETGDGNPGATNVFRAAGPYWGSLALLGDILKALIPVGIAYHIFGWDSLIIAPIGIATSLGHAFSPFLGGNGGKALATIGGTWIALTWYEMTLVLAIAIIVTSMLIKPDGWAAFLTNCIGLLYLYLFLPDPAFLTLMALQVALVAWTHRAELLQRPSLKRLRST